MLKFLPVLIISAFLAGCTTNRYFVMTRQSSGESFAALNRDLSKYEPVFVVPDSAAQRREWTAKRDSMITNVLPAAYDTMADFGPDWPVPQPAYGIPREAHGILVTPDSVCFALGREETVTRHSWEELHGLMFEKTRQSVPLGMLRGMAFCSICGGVFAAGVVGGFLGEREVWTKDDWEAIGVSALIGAGVGTVVGLILGSANPVTLTERTHILLDSSRPTTRR